MQDFFGGMQEFLTISLQNNCKFFFKEILSEEISQMSFFTF